MTLMVPKWSRSDNDASIGFTMCDNTTCRHHQIGNTHITGYTASLDSTAASAHQPSLDYEDFHDPLDCPEDIDGHKGARIPKWMLPELDDNLRNKLRPDILRISGLPCTIARPPQSRHERRHLLIEILKIGFCSDTRWKSSTRRSNNMNSSLAY